MNDERCRYAQYAECLARSELRSCEVERYANPQGGQLVLHFRGAEEPRGSIYGAPRAEWRRGQTFYSVRAANSGDYWRDEPTWFERCWRLLFFGWW